MRRTRCATDGRVCLVVESHSSSYATAIPSQICRLTPCHYDGEIRRGDTPPARAPTLWLIHTARLRVAGAVPVCKDGRTIVRGLPKRPALVALHYSPRVLGREKGTPLLLTGLRRRADPFPDEVLRVSTEISLAGDVPDVVVLKRVAEEVGALPPSTHCRHPLKTAASRLRFHSQVPP